MKIFRYPLAAVVFCATLSVATVKPSDIPDPVVISLPKDVGKPPPPIIRVIIKQGSDVTYERFPTNCAERECRWR